jgi:uncharacterized protein YndB with AHSA1/START domain
VELGALTRAAADRWQLEFVRQLPHPPARVWRAITEPQHQSAWFPARMEGERREGAALRFVFEHDEGPPGSGEVLACDPPRLFAVSWDEDVLRFELAPDGDGTVLTFRATFDPLGRAARDGAGWHACLDALAAELADVPEDERPQRRWADVHPAYVAAFGPEAATIGPPEGHPEA